MSQDEIEASSAPLIEHLIELRPRLIWSIVAFFVAFLVLLLRFAKQCSTCWSSRYVLAAGIGPRSKLIYTAPQEYLLHPGQARDVRRLVHRLPDDRHADLQIRRARPLQERAHAFLPFLVASPILFLLGAALVYFFFTPMVMWFFLSHAADRRRRAGADFAAAESVGISQPDHDADLLLRSGLPAAGGHHADGARRAADRRRRWREKRKWAIVIAFVVAAVLTPPDPISQIGLAIPTILLYEVSIWSARLIEKRREEERIAREQSDDATSDGDGESA